MAKTLGPVAALLLGVFFLVTGSGLQNTLLPLRGAFEGFSAVSLGVLGSSYYLGFVAGCLIVPRLVRRTGHIRAFAVLTSSAVAAMLVHPLWIEPAVWFVLRAVTGFCFAGLYLVIESWLNDRATNQTRGFVMSAYVIVDYAALTAGQMMITLSPVRGFELFAVAAILFSLATLPVAMTGSGQPAPIETARIRLLRLTRAAPVGVVGCFVVGLTNGSLWSLGPIFGIGRGLTADGAATFMSAAVVAGAIAQWPVGFLSDRMDRRRILAWIVAGAMVAGLVLGSLPLGLWGLSGLALIYGALALPAYSLAAAHAYDRTSPSEAVETAAGLLLAYGVGSVLGPSVASVGMLHWGPGALFYFTAISHLMLFAFVQWRMVWKKEVPPTAKAAETVACSPTGMVPVPEAPTLAPVAGGEAASAAELAAGLATDFTSEEPSPPSGAVADDPVLAPQDGRSDGA
ncbi:MFS transporter [Ancylobacter sonchi]|uniref:MFS transporter n=1 Tax=Ancylobacter sonchi TaxID=1937790 RepID=UPI001BD5C491|nr:MFS transporter [Ancylobacter sonchi]MBS7535897.1 MFS transporter [Ancylobacter sonchi]